MDLITRRAREGECLACGTPLPEDAGPRRTYCDRRCQRDYYRGDVVREQGTCQRCGVVLPADSSPLRRWCSQRHRQAAYVERHAERRSCAHCGDDLAGTARQARYCQNRPCRDRARRVRNREADRAAARQRYAAKREAL